MFKTLTAVLVLIFSLAACSSEAEPVDLSGHWVSVSQDANPMAADIRNETITVNWMMDDVRALYWKGSFPLAAGDDSVLISSGDTETMALSLLASMDETKEFFYEDEQILFELTIMGMTQTIRLEKVE